MFILMIVCCYANLIKYTNTLNNRVEHMMVPAIACGPQFPGLFNDGPLVKDDEIGTKTCYYVQPTDETQCRTIPGLDLVHNKSYLTVLQYKTPIKKCIYTVQ